LDDFEIIDILGQGAFGIVKLAKGIYDKMPYAIKIFNKEEILKEKQIE
jgi:serine/threonine protein kinase